MKRTPLMMRCIRVCLGTLLLTLATLCASAASPKRVLILDPFDREVAPFSVAASSFRTTLARELGEPVDFYEIPLDLARFTGSEGEGPLMTFMEGRIKSRPVDLVVAIGGAGVQFAARHRKRLFPDIPVLIPTAEPRLVPVDFLRTNAALVTQRVNLPGFVEDILQMQPQTTNIVVVFGTSAVENFWVKECRREFQSFTNRVSFTWLNDLPLDQVLKRCAALPPHSFIFHGLFVVDAAGVPCSSGEPLRQLHAVANAPVFGIFSSEFGLGTIGGRLYRDSEVGEQGARAAIRILHGEKPGSISPQVFEAAAPVYDWRELQRWCISEANLPAGSLIEFREPTLWERYRWHIVGVLVFCCLQTALIISLFVNSLARKRADRALRESEERMTLAAEAAQFGIWGWNIDRNQVWGSKRWLRLFGFASGEDVSFEKVIQRIHPDHRETVEREMRRALVDRSDYAGEFRAVLPVGTQRWIAFRGRGQADEGGKPARMLGTAMDITERKQAQENLAQLHRQYELILDSTTEGILGLDLQGNHIFVNVAAARMLGYEAKELLGRHSHSLWHHTRPDGSRYPEEECKIYASMVDGKVHQESAGVFWRKDGTSFPVEYASTPICEQGRLLGAVVTFEDITERRRADGKVRQLSLAVEQSPVSVVITDTQGRITYVNRRFSEVSGYSFAECIGQNPRLLKSGECAPSTYQELWTRITSGGMWRGELCNRKKNGELYWEWAVLSPLLDATGKITHFVGVKSDITEAKRSEAALRASEELNRVTFEQAAVGIAHVGTDGRWLRVNDKLCAIVGYPREELLGLTFQDITHPEDLEKDLNCVRQVLSGEIKNYSMEKRYLRKDRSMVWVILTASLVRNAAGTPMHFISVVEDITERKQVEAALRDLSGRLINAHEEERARLGRELHDDVTQRLARLAIDAGCVERGTNEVSPAETMRSVRDNLVRLSEDIHSLSYRLHPAVLEDLGLVEALKAECERFSRQEAVPTDVTLREVRSVIPREPALCLFRVAQEALRNVARHAKARMVKVSMGVQDGGVQLAVRDDGVGFAPALQRERPSLGLASMRERVRLVEGELDIESAPGQGTTILVWVPLKKAKG